ncbi:MAG: hypothetical protein MJE68_05325 [Proteobacteria bacterium]|nr:hypothetical protein [Pseudomonadota bacterium]
MSGLQKYLNTDNSNYDVKRYTCQRATIIDGLLKDTPLFQNTEHELSNIFTSKPNKLKEHQARDLSAITTVGTKRMEQYCKDYIFGKESLKKFKKIQN